MSSRLIPLAMFAAMALPGAASAQESIWQDYTNPEFGYSAELPLGVFEPVGEQTPAAMRFGEIGGDGQLSVYAGAAEGLTLADFAEQLSAGAASRTVTYEAGGDSWLVVSGIFEAETPTAEPLIFYTKVLLSADRETFSGFEISYPQSQRDAYWDLVDRLEDNFGRPS